MLIDFREKGREAETERNINMREKYQSVPSCLHPDQEPNLKPRHMPWPGIEPATFRFMGWCSNWPPAARAAFPFLNFNNHLPMCPEHLAVFISSWYWDPVPVLAGSWIQIGPAVTTVVQEESDIHLGGGGGHIWIRPERHQRWKKLEEKASGTMEQDPRQAVSSCAGAVSQGTTQGCLWGSNGACLERVVGPLCDRHSGLCHLPLPCLLASPLLFLSLVFPLDYQFTKSLWTLLLLTSWSRQPSTYLPYVMFEFATVFKLTDLGYALLPISICLVMNCAIPVT